MVSFRLLAFCLGSRQAWAMASGVVACSCFLQGLNFSSVTRIRRKFLRSYRSRAASRLACSSGLQASLRLRLIGRQSWVAASPETRRCLLHVFGRECDRNPWVHNPDRLPSPARHQDNRINDPTQSVEQDWPNGRQIFRFLPARCPPGIG